MQRETAVDEVDAIIEGLAMTLSSDVARLVSSGEVIEPDDIAHRLIDEPLGSAQDSLIDVFGALTEDDDSEDDDDMAKLQEADRVLETIVDALNHELWDLLHDWLARGTDEPPVDALGDVRDVILRHREVLMDQVDRLAPTPSSSESESGMGVVLPIARGRR